MNRTSGLTLTAILLCAPLLAQGTRVRIESTGAERSVSSVRSSEATTEITVESRRLLSGGTIETDPMIAMVAEQILRESSPQEPQVIFLPWQSERTLPPLGLSGDVVAAWPDYGYGYGFGPGVAFPSSNAWQGRASRPSRPARPSHHGGTRSRPNPGGSGQGQLRVNR